MREKKPLTSDELMEYMRKVLGYNSYTNYSDYGDYTWNDTIENDISSKEEKPSADLINCEREIREFLKLNGYYSSHTNLINEDNHRLIINRFYFVANKKTSFRHYFDDVAKHDKWLVEYLSPICKKYKIFNIHFQSGNSGSIDKHNVIL